MSSSLAPRGSIVPGRLFEDDAGRPVQLHGAGIRRIGDRYYAWGEDKSHGGTFGGVACYSSPDLATWTSHGHALAVTPDVPDLAPGRVVERPKVLPAPDGTYVMFLHIDSADYADARLGWAVADRPEGPYTYLRSERPLGNISRDIGVFLDDDGTGYLLSEDREHGLHVYRLSVDLLTVEEVVSTTLAPPSDHPAGPHGYESPAMIKVDGLYYLFGSDLTGWSTNDNKYATAPSPAGPWSAWNDVAPPGTATFDSQVSDVVTVPGTEQTAYVYVGDRWDRHDLFRSPPVVLPLQVAGGRADLVWRDSWTIDTTTGVIS
ncbi:family 43 glycosylhydrolase [Isoptericola croceus]|uniref:family 43 glycosylhydrolase n=1 Tax=Isoptericola croceus TaxID=3031406 RepID=UPI0023F9A8B7|nr:family 43 glycosylhydrolase [Isoptericola croceus]